MREETAKLVIEMLREIYASAGRIEFDLSDLNIRLSAVENILGQHQLMLAAINCRMVRTDERLGRVERRLDLVDASRTARERKSP